jgi:hypothetical protein
MIACISWTLFKLKKMIHAILFFLKRNTRHPIVFILKKILFMLIMIVTSLEGCKTMTSS